MFRLNTCTRTCTVYLVNVYVCVSLIVCSDSAISNLEPVIPITFDTGRLQGLTPSLLSNLALLSGLAEESPPKTSPREGGARQDGERGNRGKDTAKEGKEERKEEEKKKELLERSLDEDIAKAMDEEQQVAGMFDVYLI